MVSSHSVSTTICGLMTSLLSCRSCRQSRLRHSLIWLHQAASASASGAAAALADLRDQLLQHVLDVADDRDVDLDALGDARRIDVDMDDLALDRREVLRVADHAVVEARADGQQHVAVLHRHVGLVGAVHAQHAEELRVAGRDGAQAHQRVGARDSPAGRPVRAVRPTHCPGSRRRRCRCTGAWPCSSSCTALRIWPPWPLRTGLYERISTGSGYVEGRRLAARRPSGCRPPPGRAGRCARCGRPSSCVSARSRTSLTRKLCLTIGRVMPTVSHSWNASRPIAGGRHLAGDDHHRDRVHVGGGDAGDGIGHARARRSPAPRRPRRWRAHSRRPRARPPARGAPAHAGSCPACTARRRCSSTAPPG